MIERHICLEGPEPRLGHAADCERCWPVLLQAFRIPAGVSEEDVIHAMGPTRPVLAEAARMRHPSGAQGSASSAGGPEPVHTAAWALDDRPGPSGTRRWKAACSCGWRQEGRYFTDAEQPMAQALAAAAVQNHMERSTLAVHAVRVSSMPTPLYHGGVWMVECTCGWERDGQWTSPQTEGWARGQAEAHAEAHLAETRDEDQA